MTQPSPSAQELPASSATPYTNQPINVEELGKSSNDAQWNTVQKASRKLLPLLGKVGTFVGGMIHTDDPIERQWIEDEYVCQYNSDDFTLTLTDFNGSRDHYSLYPSGEMWTREGSILGTVNSDGDITRIDPQDDIDYRRWVAGGGEPGYEVWRAQGKPKDFDGSIASAPNKNRALSFEDALVLAGDAKRAEIVSQIGTEIQPALEAIRKLDPNAQIGFRGSLASGLKNSTILGPNGERVAFDGVVSTKNGQPFTGEQGFDLDFFIVSDDLASRFPKKQFFKDVTRLDSSLKPVFGNLSKALNSNPALQGLKQEDIVFRVFNSSQIQKMLEAGDAQIFFTGK